MIECRVLGPPEVRVNGEPAPAELLWRKNLALLVYLARSPRRRRSREHLVGLLWGDKPESAARHSLNEALRVLRRHGGEGTLETDGQQVRLAEGAVRLDADLFEERVVDEDWDGASGLVTGAFLEGFGVPDASGVEDWLAAERAAWTRRCVDCLVRRAEQLVARGDPSAAIGLAERALSLDSLSGAAVRALMRCHALNGDRSGALRHFEDFAARLGDELRAEPEPETRLLADRVRRERGWKLAPVDEGAAPRIAFSRRVPLVGRERELESLLGAWSGCRDEGKAAAVIIGGDPGTGKTRLAEEVAARCRLDGASVTAIRAVPADVEEAWSGVLTLARGGLIEAPGIVVAAPGALAAFGAHAPEWRVRFASEIGDAEPLHLGRALSEILRAAAEEQPVLLLVDDAHCLDGDSLRALLATLRDVRDAPLFLVLSAAPVPSREELEELRARVGRDVPGTAVRLSPLPPEALRALARWALPAYGEEELERLVRRVTADSAGLPLLAVELLHAVALGLELRGDAEAWPVPYHTLDQTLPGELPDLVVAALRIGFRRLGRAAQELLAAAAVLGDRVPGEALRRGTGLSEEELEEGLDELEWSRWLVAEPRGYAFVAGIVREVIVRDMVTPGKAQRIRRRAVSAEGAEPSA
ncbi:MAG: AAA family ATPase [Gemmatimonadota bacterium]